jgi:hypothetical protein
MSAMKFDWKKQYPDTPEGDLQRFDDAISRDQLDWSEPTHVPFMVNESVDAIGNLGECLSDDEFNTACAVALDAMPMGKEHVMQEVQELIRSMAAVDGWSDWIYMPGTNKYPWEAFEDS